MLSKKEAALLTQVAPGTPCGELLRRYWQPACFAAELTDDRRVHERFLELVREGQRVRA